jgi:hypothetical protein
MLFCFFAFSASPLFCCSASRCFFASQASINLNQNMF